VVKINTGTLKKREAGWGSVEPFRHSLDWLRKHSRGRIPRERRLHLIVACSSVHRSDDIKRYATRRGIQLSFILAGFTDELQPLDRDVFGAIKAMFRGIFERLLGQSPNRRVTKATAMQILKEI
jgi:hypothetical protein